MKPDIDILLSSSNANKSIIELDNYICELCKWGEEVQKLSGPQKAFFFNQNIEREINNGGFRLFFLNSSGDFSHETIESLQAIGAYRTVGILQSAINQFSDGIVPKNRESRVNLVNKMDGKILKLWNELDDQFFKYEDKLNALNLDFVRRNRDSF